ncbi:hypothetical protein COO60DRAFT_1469313, partial [Scenedesmus sp. NREL 46B-D3]
IWQVTPKTKPKTYTSTLKTRALQLLGAVQAAWRCSASEAIVQVPSMQYYRLLPCGRPKKRWPLSRFAKLQLLGHHRLRAELGNMGGNKGTKLACGQHRLCAKFVAAADHPLGCAWCACAIVLLTVGIAC